MSWMLTWGLFMTELLLNYFNGDRLCGPPPTFSGSKLIPNLRYFRADILVQKNGDSYG